MITVHASADCGCCYEEMQFESAESAAAAFQQAGLGNGIVIVDDAGVRHEGIDTFYGFSVQENEQASRGLGYLIEKINEKIR